MYDLCMFIRYLVSITQVLYDIYTNLYIAPVQSRGGLLVPNKEIKPESHFLE
jgi:hypothetical protein